MTESLAGFLPTDVSTLQVYSLTVNQVYKIYTRYPWNGGVNSDGVTSELTALNFNEKYFRVLGIYSFAEAQSKGADVYNNLYKPLTVQSNSRTEVTAYDDQQDAYALDAEIMGLFPVYQLQNTDDNTTIFMPCPILNQPPDSKVKQYSAVTLGFNLGLQRIAAETGEDDIGLIEDIAKELLSNLKTAGVIPSNSDILPMVFTYKNRYRTDADFETERLSNPTEDSINAITSMYNEISDLRSTNADLKAKISAYEAYLKTLN